MSTSYLHILKPLLQNNNRNVFIHDFLLAYSCCADQGTNARKVISEVFAFLYCSVLSLGGKVNTRNMSQPDMESIFKKIIYEISRENWFEYERRVYAIAINFPCISILVQSVFLFKRWTLFFGNFQNIISIYALKPIYSQLSLDKIFLFSSG